MSSLASRSRNRQSLFLPQCEWPSFTPIQNTLYIWIFLFLDGELEDKILCPEWWQASPNSIFFQFLHDFCSVLLVVLSSQISELYDILCVCTFWFCIAFCSQDISIHSVAIENASVFVIPHPFPLNWIFNIILSSTEWLSSAPDVLLVTR